MNAKGQRSIGAFGELRKDIEPARDLWPGIAAAIGAGTAGETSDGAGRTRGPAPASGVARRRGFATPRPAWAIAAAVACVAVGVWVGRASVDRLPVVAATDTLPAGAPARAQSAVFAPDARFERTRDALLQDLGARLAQLPPGTRAKVEASLADVRRARAQIEAALGRDSGNALLQELLLNSYQDEMRVLTAVRETWVPQPKIGARA